MIDSDELKEGDLVKYFDNSKDEVVYAEVYSMNISWLSLTTKYGGRIAKIDNFCRTASYLNDKEKATYKLRQ